MALNICCTTTYGRIFKIVTNSGTFQKCDYVYMLIFGNRGK